MADEAYLGCEVIGMLAKPAAATEGSSGGEGGSLVMMGVSSVAFLLFLPEFALVELFEFAMAAICFALPIATFLISPPFIVRA